MIEKDLSVKKLDKAQRHTVTLQCPSLKLYYLLTESIIINFDNVQKLDHLSKHPFLHIELELLLQPDFDSGLVFLAFRHLFSRF